MALICLPAPIEGTQDGSWKKEGDWTPRWEVFISNENPSTVAVYWKRQAPPRACTWMAEPAVSLFPPKWGYSLLDYIEAPFALCSLVHMDFPIQLQASTLFLSAFGMSFWWMLALCSHLQSSSSRDANGQKFLPKFDALVYVSLLLFFLPRFLKFFSIH